MSVIGGVGGETKSSPDQACRGGQSPPLAPACQEYNIWGEEMGKKKQVKKVQISIPEEQYQKVENLWLGLGFSSIAEAAKFLLMDNVNEFYKQTKKSQKAVAKLKDLKKNSNSSVAEVAHVQPKVRQSGKALSANQQTSGYIKKSSIEYERIIAQWQKQNQDFVEPPDVNGLRWSIDEKTNKRKVEWWKNGSK